MEILLSELFEVRNGLASSEVKISPTKDAAYDIPYIRPSSTRKGTLAGYVMSAKAKMHTYPEETIIVSTDGQGSHTYSYVTSFKFVPNSNVAVLIPRIQMSLNEKIFYAHCITLNRYKFSYGRKPKGKRLKNIKLPMEVPDYVNETEIKQFNYSMPYLKQASPSLNAEAWKGFKYGDLFMIKKGKRLTKKSMIVGKTPFIGSSDANNGLTARIGQPPIHKANTISVCYNGSVAEAFYQAEDYWATDDVNVLYPNFRLNKYIALFLTTLIRKEKYRFNYGRKWHLGRMNESTIKLPVDKLGEPDWAFMEAYIKSLPYSSRI